MHSENAPAHVLNTPQAVEGKENHHEKKPMLMKMKERVKKVKDNINKKMHAHDDDGLHSYGHVDEEEDSFEETDKSEMDVDPQVNGAPVYDSTAQIGNDRQDPAGKATFGDTKGRFEDDPLPVSQKFAGGDRNSSRTGANEIEPSSVIDSFKGMTVSDEPEGPRGKDLPAVRSPTAGTHDQFSPRREPDEVVERGPRGSKDFPVDRTPTTGTHDQFSPPEKTPFGAPEPRTAAEPVVEKGPTGSEDFPADRSPATGTHDQFSPPEKTRFGEPEQRTATEPVVEKETRGGDLPANRYGTHDQFSLPEETQFGEPEMKIATEPAIEKEPRGKDRSPKAPEKTRSGEQEVRSATSLPEETQFGEPEMKITTEPAIEKEPRGKDRFPKAPEKTRSGEQEVKSATEPGVEKGPSYTAKLTSMVMAVKDTAVTAASTAYDKVTAAVAKPQQAEGGQQVEKSSSVREYLADRLRPGEDEKALSEVLSEAVHKRKVDGGPEEGPKVTEVSGGKGMVEKIKGVVTSLVGGNGVSGAPQVSKVEGGKGAQQEFSKREDGQDIE